MFTFMGYDNTVTNRKEQNMTASREQKRILIADSDRLIRQEIRTYGEFDGFIIAEAADGETARAMLQKNRYDLAVLNVSLPGISGISLLGERILLGLPPVMMLSNGYDEIECLRCFELGAEDYVVKPYYPKELVMRFHVIVGNDAPKPERHPVRHQITKGPISMDTANRTVFLAGAKQEIPPKAFDLLRYFMEHQGEALSRKQLMRDIWERKNSPFDRTLDTHVKLLRTMLGPHRDIISTVRRVGYRFDADTESK